MTITYDPTHGCLLVVDGQTVQFIREFYIDARKEAGVTVSRLEQQLGINHPTLSNLEYTNRKGYRSRATLPILAALEGLGYVITIEKKS